MIVRKQKTWRHENSEELLNLKPKTITNSLFCLSASCLSGASLPSRLYSSSVNSISVKGPSHLATSWFPFRIALHQFQKEKPSVLRLSKLEGLTEMLTFGEQGCRRHLWMNTPVLRQGKTSRLRRLPVRKQESNLRQPLSVCSQSVLFEERGRKEVVSAIRDQRRALGITRAAALRVPKSQNVHALKSLEHFLGWFGKKHYLEIIQGMQEDKKTKKGLLKEN